MRCDKKEVKLHRLGKLEVQFPDDIAGLPQKERWSSPLI